VSKKLRLDDFPLIRFSAVIFAAILTLLLSSYSHSHGGGLSSYGCHTQTSNASYHCHSGNYSGLSFASQETFLSHVQSQTGVVVAHVKTPLGDFSIELFANITPGTVSNFLNYVNSGRYDGVLFHRSVMSFVLQGGGYIFNESNYRLDSVRTDEAIQNEFNVSNTRGTISMAKLGGNPNSATSQWFINLADNSINLDGQNGGFTVFGKVIGDGMDVVDRIAALQTYTVAGLSDFPLNNYTGGALISDNFIEMTITQTDSSITYSRDDYLPYWIDEDGDCINTRHEALIIESQIPVTMSEDGCSVLSGEWLDQATNQIFTEALDIDIDHTVPLAEAHVSGASYWPIERKRVFANDLLNSQVLKVMDDSSNASKSDKDPSEWLPPNESYHCDYVKNWVEVKTLYGLTVDEDEKIAIEKILNTSVEYGARKGVLGIQASTGKEMARFAMGITEGNNCGYSSAGSLYQNTLIDFSISPDKSHLGQAVDILVVAVLGDEIYSISDKAGLVPFTGDASSLVAFIPSTVFRESFSFKLVESVFSEAINVPIYIAYRLDNGDLIYSTEPFIAEIK